MNTVKNLLNRKGRPLISVAPETPVFDALKVMADENIGSVSVMDGEDFLGIMTERDYSRKVILKNKHSNDTQIREIMSTELPRVSPETSIGECMELMNDKNIRYLPVFENDKIAGIISISDVIRETILAQQQAIDHLENYIRS